MLSSKTLDDIDGRRRWFHLLSAHTPVNAGLGGTVQLLRPSRGCEWTLRTCFAWPPRQRGNYDYAALVHRDWLPLTYNDRSIRDEAQSPQNKHSQDLTTLITRLQGLPWQKAFKNDAQTPQEITPGMSGVQEAAYQGELCSVTIQKHVQPPTTVCSAMKPGHGASTARLWRGSASTRPLDINHLPRPQGVPRRYLNRRPSQAPSRPLPRWRPRTTACPLRLSRRRHRHRLCWTCELFLTLGT